MFGDIQKMFARFLYLTDPRKVTSVTVNDAETRADIRAVCDVKPGYCVRTADANKYDFLDNHCGAWCFDKLNRRRGINPVRRRKRTSAPGSVNKSHHPARAMGGVLTGRPYCEHHCIRLIAGGSWNNGSGAGVSAANSNNDLGNANANIGARSVIISRNNDGCGHAARRNIEYERQGWYLRGRSCNKMKG